MIYKEDELGIKDSGGGEHGCFEGHYLALMRTPAADTELCPFDCDCCESESGTRLLASVSH